MTDQILPDPAAKLRIAAEYVQRGWKVFVLGAGRTPLPNCAPCNAAKHAEHDRERCDCLTCHGFYAATADINRIELMLTFYPDGHLAVRTGWASGIFVIDAESTADDSGATGLDTLDAWESWTNSSLPDDTLRARSASGGVHVFFEYVAPTKSRNRILPQVDIKGDGGYVLVPQGGTDRVWLNEHSVKQPPQTLVAFLDQARGGGRGSTGFASGYDYQLFAREGCPDGHRDEFTNDMCFRLRKTGATRDEAEAELKKHWEKFPQPPEARYAMPWEHVLYKITRVWQTVVEDDPIPVWRPDQTPVEETVEVPEVSASESRRQETNAPAPAVVRVEPPPEGIIGEERGSDLGNTERLARIAGHDYRFIASLRRWLRWDGSRWVPDELNTIMHQTLAVTADLRRQAEITQDTDEARRWAQLALQSESWRSRQAMVRGAEVHPALAASVTAFDRDPNLLVVVNGTLDLTTGKLRASRRDDLNSRRADVTFDPAAKCPRWREHIKIVTQSDHVLAAYLRRAIGYTLTGLTGEQVFFMLEGDGDNGKNAFIEPVIAVMGDYAQVGTSALLTGGDEQHPTIMADLVGARLVFVDEARQGRPLNVERVKQLTGSAKIKARRMGQDFFEFDAQLKLWIAGNNHPTMRDPSSGIWRRLQRILFNAKIPKERKTKDYARILFQEEAPGILNWALEGLKDWRQLNGLGQPPSVEAATEDLRTEEDYVGQFIEERLIVTHDTGDVVINAELFTEFSIWATLNGIPMSDRPNRTQFGRALSSKGFERWKGATNGVAQRGFTGMRIART